MENLPGADAVRFRPVCLDILHTARLPAPCVVDEEFSVDTEHPIEQFFIVVFVRLADGAFSAGDIFDLCKGHYRHET